MAAETVMRPQTKARWRAGLFATASSPSAIRAAFLTIVVVLGTIAPALAQPSRIVSLNLCTDQMALMLAPRESIRSLSYLAVRPDISAASDRAGGLLLNHGRAEEVLPLNPDIILAGRYTSRPTVFLLKRLGYDVLDQDISLSIADVRERVREAGRALGRISEAEAEVAAMDRRLEALAPHPGAQRPTAIYYQPNGLTAGADTLAGDIIAHAGLDNLGARAGVRGHGRMPLELLLDLRPEILIVDDRRPQAPALAYEALRHPALKAMIDRSVQVIVPTRLWICGIPTVVDAVEILATVRATVIAGRGT